MSYFFGHFTPPTDRVWYIIHKVLKFLNILVPTIWKSGSKFLLSEISKKTLEIMKFQADHWGCQIVIFRSFFKFFQLFSKFSHIFPHFKTYCFRWCEKHFFEIFFIFWNWIPVKKWWFLCLENDFCTKKDFSLIKHNNGIIIMFNCIKT